NIWAANRHVPKSFLLMRYEDLHANAGAELARLLDFVGVGKVSADCIAEAVEFAQFSNMRKIESSGKAGTSALVGGGGNDDESFKTRRGVVGGFQDYLSADQIRVMSELMAKRLSPVFGYRGD